MCTQTPGANHNLEVCNVRDIEVVLLQIRHGWTAYLALLTLANAHSVRILSSEFTDL